MQSVMRYTGLSARERDAAIRGVPVPARLADGAGRDCPHSPNAVSRPAPVKIVLIAVLVIAFPFAVPTACSIVLVAGLIYAPIAVASRAPLGRGIAVCRVVGRGPGHGLVRAPACLDARRCWRCRSRWWRPPTPGPSAAGSCRAARSPGHCCGRCRSAWRPACSIAYPPVVAAGARLAAGLRRARLAAGQVAAGRPGTRPPAGQRRRAGRAARLAGHQAAAGWPHRRRRRPRTAGSRWPVTWSAPGIPADGTRSQPAAGAARAPRRRPGRRRSRLTRRWRSSTP